MIADNNFGTDNILEKVFENVKYFMKALNKYFNLLGYKTALPRLKLITIHG